MSTSRVVFFAALAGAVSALGLYAFVITVEALKSFFPITYVHLHDDVWPRLLFMFWPQGYGFFVAASGAPVVVYVLCLVLAVMMNALIYAFIALVARLCMKVAKIAVLIPILPVLAYWALVIGHW